ncbi:MAG: hypothetical protein IH802_08820, partial [Nitrospinae bacterium]|nr:hypothetical protein [Nitrospinota bacterium]
YLDIWVPPGQRKVLPVESSRQVFAYIFEGTGSFRDASDPQPVMTENVAADGTEATELGNRSLVLFDQGDNVTVQAGPEGIRFLLVSGKPIGEPVACRGPIVMNTNEELLQAWGDLKNGTFQYPMTLPLSSAPGRSKFSEFMPIIYSYAVSNPCQVFSGELL